MRRTILTAVMASSLAVGLVWAGQDPVPVPLPPGTAPKQLNDQDDVRDVLNSAVHATLTKGAFDDLAERFSTPDRKRLGEYAKRDLPDLDAQIEQFRTAWKARYGQDVRPMDKHQLHALLVMVEGEVTDTALARMHWPVKVIHPRPNEAIPASESASSAEYLNKGRNIAIVAVASSSEKLPPLHISMLRENIDSWRIDLPDSVTAEQIHTNVLATLTRFTQKIDTWPADSGEASRQLAYLMLAAVHNVPAPTAEVTGAR